MVYLDTNIVIRLVSGETSSFSEKIKVSLETEELFISPMVILEIGCLHEVNKFKFTPQTSIDYLKNKANLKICDEPFINVIQEALEIKWTRDPFDRLIVAHAQMKKAILLTKDQTILKNYKKALWD